MTTKVWVPISVCPRGSCWLPRPVSAHSWFLPCLPPQSAADGEEAVWWHSSDLGGGDYLFRVSNLADRWKDECVCFVCKDIMYKIKDRHLESIGHNQGLLVHLIWQISPKRNKKLTCGWEEYDFLIITEQLRDVANNQNQCFCTKVLHLCINYKHFLQWSKSYILFVLSCNFFYFDVEAKCIKEESL